MLLDQIKLLNSMNKFGGSLEHMRMHWIISNHLGVKASTFMWVFPSEIKRLLSTDKDWRPPKLDSGITQMRT